MELGSIVSDNIVNLANSNTKHHMDGTKLRDPFLVADGLSMVCMSDAKIPISYDSDSKLATDGSVASNIPLILLRTRSEQTSRLLGSFLVFSSWNTMELAFDEYSLQESFDFTQNIRQLTKYQRSHVEAAVTNYLQQPSVGWKPRSVSIDFFSFSTYGLRIG